MFAQCAIDWKFVSNHKTHARHELMQFACSTDYELWKYNAISFNFSIAKVRLIAIHTPRQWRHSMQSVRVCLCVSVCVSIYFALVLCFAYHFQWIGARMTECVCKRQRERESDTPLYHSNDNSSEFFVVQRACNACTLLYHNVHPHDVAHNKERTR